MLTKVIWKALRRTSLLAMTSVASESREGLAGTVVLLTMYLVVRSSKKVSLIFS